MYKINEISNQLGVTKRTLRYYEDFGLIESTRDDTTGYRFYGDETINQIKLILLLKGMKFSLKDIKKVISSENINELSRALHTRIRLLEDGIDELMIAKERSEKVLEYIKRGIVRGKTLDEFLNQIRILVSREEDSDIGKKSKVSTEITLVDSNDKGNKYEITCKDDFSGDEITIELQDDGSVTTKVT